jgi:hypothetical protein
MTSAAIEMGAEPLPPVGVSVFEAQEGPQSWLVSCPVEDALFGGARGGGKTWGVLLDWIAYQDEYGEHARGALFRRKYKGLQEAQRVARILFRPLGAYYRAGDRTWVFPNKATLTLQYLRRDKDAEDWQGFSFGWLCVEELTQYPNSVAVDLLRATLRVGEAPVPKYFRATANPGGVGHNWVKARYIDPAPPTVPFFDGETRKWRVFIPSRLEDNPKLLANDPDYWTNVRASVGDNTALLRAWRWGIWDIVAGGMFDDAWRRAVHVIEPFEIPRSWYVDRAFDWGSSKPFSVGFWAESDGTIAPNSRTYPRGTLFRISEWYGCVKGKANVGLKMLATEIAEGVKEREQLGVLKRLKVNKGPADSQIYDVVNGVCIADQMLAKGVAWTPANKGPGTRKTGAELLRTRMKASRKRAMEDPGIFVFSTCTDWIRTVPVLPRDERDPDDVDSKAEDHAYDETRYRLLEKRKGPPSAPASAGERARGGRDVRAKLQ